MTIQGASLGSHTEQMLQAFVRKLAEIGGHAVQGITDDRALKMHEWTAVTKPDGSWAGQVRLHTADYETALKIHEGLRGTPLWTSVSWCHITVTNQLLPTSRPGVQTVRAPESPAWR